MGVLGLKDEEVAGLPEITSILERAPGGLKSVLAALRFSEDGDVKAFVKTVDRFAPSFALTVPWEVFAVAAQVEMTALLGAMTLALRDYNANIVKVMMSTSHPLVTQATIENALMPGGVKDRNIVHTAMRLLPAAKGPTFMFNLPGSGAAAVESGEEEEIDLDEVFPSMETTRKLMER